MCHLALRSVPKGNRSIDKSRFTICNKVYYLKQRVIIFNIAHKSRGFRIKSGMTMRREGHYQTFAECRSAFLHLALRSVPKGNRSIDKSRFTICNKVYYLKQRVIIFNIAHKPRRFWINFALRSVPKGTSKY